MKDDERYMLLHFAHCSTFVFLRGPKKVAHGCRTQQFLSMLVHDAKVSIQLHCAVAFTAVSVKSTVAATAL